MTEPLNVTDVDFDDTLNWVAPETPGQYVFRYEVRANEGTFTDDVVVTVAEAPTGPQTISPESIPSQARVGEPTIVVEPPEGVQVTHPGAELFPGANTWPGYGPPPGPVEQTITPESIPSRAIVGQPAITVDEVPVELDITPESIPSRARVGAPSITVGSAPPGESITDLSLSLFAIDPATGRGIPLPKVEQLDYARLRNSPGSIAIHYPTAGENFAVLRDAITSGRDIEWELWFGGTPDGADRGYFQAAEGDDVAEGGFWGFGGGRLGLRLGQAIIPPQDPGPLVPDDDDDPDNDEHANEKRELIFNQATPGVVMATAMQIVREQDWLTDITWDFTATHDSEGNEWPQVITSRFSPGTTVLQIADRLVALQLAEWDLVWTGTHRVLRLWVPQGRGVDLTDSPRPVVLRHGQNVLDAPRRWDVSEAATDVWVAGADGLYAEASDPQAVHRRGRRIAKFISANNLADDEAVTAYAINQLPIVTSPMHEVTHGIAFQPGQPRPLVTYDIGDWVLSETGNLRERLRIVEWTLGMSSDRQLSGTVTLNDTRTDWLSRLKAQLEAITAGETVIGTSQPPTGSLDDITPPAAPEGLVASSIAYQDPAHTQVLASVTVGWQPVRTNADGSNYPQVQAARWVILRLEDYDPEREDETGIDDDWTWEECPQVVVEYAPALRSEYDGPSDLPDDIPAMLTWLQAYVDEFSATPTATDDVAGYQVRYAYIGLDQVGGLPSSDPFPDDQRFYYEATPSNGIPGTSYTFGGVEGGANIRIEVRAFDRSGNFGPWASIGHDTAVDDTPPAQPSAPTGAKAWFRTLDVPWDGLDLIGAPMPIDFDHTEVWISQGSDFATVPADRATDATAFDPAFTGAQHVGNLFAAGTHNIPDLAYGVGYFVALRAVDRAGNPSPLSGVVGPVTAEKLFPDDLRDEIINSPELIAKLVIGTAHIVDGAIVNAKIGTLAVNDANIADLNVGKLRSGTMIAQVTISGKFRTHESDAANRVEFDAAGIRLYRGSTVVGDWRTSDASMLVTGTYRSALVGERIEIHPDGTLRFYPSSGTNYSQMSNVGAEVVWRGPVGPDGRSGRLNVNALGVGLNFSAESEIPNNMRSEIVLFDRRAHIRAPFIAFEVNGKLPTPAGDRRRVQFHQLSSSGTVMPYSYVQYGTSSSSGRGGFFGNGAGWKFEAGQMLVTDESLNSFGVIRASSFDTPSSIEVKRDVIDIEDESVPLDPQQPFREVPGVQFNYIDDPTDAPPRYGVIAEQLPEQLTRLGPDGKGGTVLSIDLGSQLGLHHAAIRRIIARLDALEGRT